MYSVYYQTNYSNKVLLLSGGHTKDEAKEIAKSWSKHTDVMAAWVDRSMPSDTKSEPTLYRIRSVELEFSIEVARVRYYREGHGMRINAEIATVYRDINDACTALLHCVKTEGNPNRFFQIQKREEDAWTQR